MSGDTLIRACMNDDICQIFRAVENGEGEGGIPSLENEMLKL